MVLVEDVLIIDPHHIWILEGERGDKTRNCTAGLVERDWGHKGRDGLLTQTNAGRSFAFGDRTTATGDFARLHRTSKRRGRWDIPLTHIALSPKEIGAEPGGTPRTFWLPV